MTSSAEQGLRPDLDRLIADARGGSTAALDALLEALSRHLWKEFGHGRKARGLGPSHGLSDLIQDTLLRVREKFELFERDTFADFKQWARTVLHRRRQEWRRNSQLRNEAERREQIGLALFARMDAQQRSGQNTDAAQLREDGERAYRAFGRLKPHEQFVINLRAIEGLRYPDIEALTGSSRDAARLAYRRAIERLRTMFESNERF